MRRSDLALLALIPMALQACDTQCVGPSCTDGTVILDDTDLPPDTDVPEVNPDDLRDERVEMLPMVRSCNVIRYHKPANGAGSVQIAGSFNGWQPADMTGPDADGWWTVDLGELTPGFYPYKYLYDGNWEEVVPDTSPLQWDGGVENRSLRVGDCTKPALQVVTASATAEGEVSADIRYALSASESPLDLSALEVTVGDQVVEPTVDEVSQLISVRVSGLAEGKHTVRVRAWDEAGNEADNDIFTPLWVEPTPFDWTDGLMYLVFVDRFRNGDTSNDGGVSGVEYRANFTGGDFLGLLQAIEEGWFTELGITSIWLSPVYENVEGGYVGVNDSNLYTGYHGYWPVKGRELESRYGDSEKSADARFREVVAAAHERGIRILFDTVLNHVHEDHEYRSLHPEWFGGGCVCGTFDCGWEEKPVECWFTPYLPDLDHKNPWVNDQMVEDTIWWMKEYDLDGFRLDAVKHMDRNMVVNLRHRVLEEVEAGGGAHVYMVGETFTGGDGHPQLVQNLGPFGMDAQFDFPFYWTIRNVFAQGGSMQNLEGIIQTGFDFWGDAPMSPFAGNHDIGRLATEIAGNDEGPWANSWDRMADGGDNVTEQWLIDNIAMALGATLTQQGVPLLYYGDEIGLAGSGDPDNRRTMSFEPFLSGNQRTLLAKTQRMGQARRELRGLQRGATTFLWAAQDVFAFARHTATDKVVVVINRGADRTTTIPIQGLIEDGVTLRDRMVDRTFGVANGELTVSLGGNDVAILAP